MLEQYLPPSPNGLSNGSESSSQFEKLKGGDIEWRSVDDDEFFNENRFLNRGVISGAGGMLLLFGGAIKSDGISDDMTRDAISGGDGIDDVDGN